MAKIIHLLDSSAYSGAEKIAIELIKNDKQNECWYVSKDGPIREVLEKLGVKHFLYNNFAELKKFTKNNDIDIIHCHDFKASIKGAVLKAKYRISHIHNNAESSKSINIKTIMYLAASLRINKIVYVSKTTMDEFVFSKRLEKKTCVIENWLNKEERLWDKECEKDIDILYVGRFKDEKNPLEVINFANKLVKKNNDIKVCLVGDGPLKEEMINMIKENSLEGNIVIEPFSDKPHFYMRRAKILMIPSRWEGFGLVVLEAMLNEAIVLGEPVGGIKNIITDGTNGYYYKGDDSIDLTLDIISDFSKYNNVRLEALNRIEDFDMSKNTQKFYDLYSDLRGV